MPAAQWPLFVVLQGDGTWGPLGGTQVCITSFTSENLPLPFTGENLGCFASLASVHGHVLGWWEQGQLASAPVCKEISGVRPGTETYKVDL